eukprot:TRINITY_DN15114_c0_g1_i1.p1 TRINITY_DN15114_c0_g1~~TRINITY_DN15114_c0_g1_i1.p1  ORF type:complete len:164 (+),score=23.38 TRINITY_DN15114_c0_g1_i1:234-725(+)
MEVKSKLEWMRKHPLYSLVLSSSGLLLMFPRVQSLLIFFWPLLLSTALLFVTAMLSLNKLREEQSLHQERLLSAEDVQSLLCNEEICEGSYKRENEAENNEGLQRSLLECVAEQHEGAVLHFDSIFHGSSLKQTAGVPRILDDSSPSSSCSEVAVASKQNHVS